MVALYNFPGPVHEGNGTMQVIIDERADVGQRDALLKIATGQETDDMATMWWVYSAMAPHKLEPLFRPIEFEEIICDRTIERQLAQFNQPGAEQPGNEWFRQGSKVIDSF